MSLPALSDSRSITLAFAQSITSFSLQTSSVIADLLARLQTWRALIFSWVCLSVCYFWFY